MDTELYEMPECIEKFKNQERLHDIEVGYVRSRGLRKELENRLR